MEKHILVINPGSTSTKIGLFRNETELFRETIRHEEEELAAFGWFYDQSDWRKGLVMQALEKLGFDIASLTAVVARGGLLPPVKAGGYIVDTAMTDLILSGTLQRHAANLGALIAAGIARPLGIPAFIYDAVSVDEYEPVARVTGLPEIERHSFAHVLNSRAVAHRYAAGCGRRYEEMNILVAHLGRGVSVTAHKKGRIVDSTTDDYGPFAPERAGSLPMVAFTDLCYSGRYTHEEMRARLQGGSGVKAHLGTSDMREVEKRMNEGDLRAALLFQAQTYQIAKGIGSLAPALGCRPDAILLTGGLARSQRLTEGIIKRVDFIAAVRVMPGEFELEALAEGGWRILSEGEAYHRLEPAGQEAV